MSNLFKQKYKYYLHSEFNQSEIRLKLLNIFLFNSLYHSIIGRIAMNTYKQKVIQHIGLVAGICNEIGIIESIDSEIQKPKRKVSVGQAVQSMILNALGFTGRVMYLHPEFYRKRPVELLAGENIGPKDLNDSCLGSALDALYDSEISKHQLLDVYKGQGISVEHGFRFLKDPMFYE